MVRNINEISRFITQLNNYPTSLNKTLMLGALKYIFLAQRKLNKIEGKDEEYLEIIELIKKYLDIVQSKLKSKREEFYLVNIDDAEEVFKKIENICSQKGILPKIENEDIDLAEFINDQSISTSIEWQEAEKEATEDIRQGRLSPVFFSAEEGIKYLRDKTNKLKDKNVN